MSSPPSGSRPLCLGSDGPGWFEVNICKIIARVRASVRKQSLREVSRRASTGDDEWRKDEVGVDGRYRPGFSS